MRKFQFVELKSNKVPVIIECMDSNSICSFSFLGSCLNNNKNISIISKENDGDISPCLFLQQPISYIVNYDSFIRQIHEVDEDNIDVFPFLETDLLYLLYGLLIVI